MIKINEIRTRRSAFFMRATAVAIFFMPSLVLAQTPATKCQVTPQQQSQSGQSTPGQTAPNGGASSQNLSGNLADCNGVLKPPATGDQGLVEPAPQTGNMPVIKPGQAPNQQGG